MSVENIIRKIDADVKVKLKDIGRRQRDIVKKETEKIQAEKERRIEEMRRREEREIKVMTNRIISQARLKKRKEVLAVREDIMEDVFRKAAEKMKSMDTEEYGSYLRRAIGNVSSVLDGEVTVRCNRESESVVRELAEKIDPNLNVEADLESIGGIIGVSRDGASVDLTFEANLERNRKILRKDICDILFTEDD